MPLATSFVSPERGGMVIRCPRASFSTSKLWSFLLILLPGLWLFAGHHDRTEMPRPARTLAKGLASCLSLQQALTVNRNTGAREAATEGTVSQVSMPRPGAKGLVPINISAHFTLSWARCKLQNQVTAPGPSGPEHQPVMGTQAAPKTGLGQISRAAHLPRRRFSKTQTDGNAACLHYAIPGPSLHDRCCGVLHNITISTKKKKSSRLSIFKIKIYMYVDSIHSIRFSLL